VSLLPTNCKLEKVEQALLSQNKLIVLQDVVIQPLERLKSCFEYIFLQLAREVELRLHKFDGR
jgi:hypothetical protein